MIKKHKNKNQYICINGMYIRNFTHTAIPVDINHIISDADAAIYMDNEFENFSQRYNNISFENPIHPNVVIVSDGYNFKTKHLELANLPKDVTIIGVNGSLKYWDMVGKEATLKKSINYYVVNNPYDECLDYLPVKHRYYPRCIASSRTNPQFLRKYLGDKQLYEPINNKNYSGIKQNSLYVIDDYRNSVCAAINLAWRFNAQKIMLFCCDNSFNDERPAAEQLDNGLWQYPQQDLSHQIIDAMLYWLKLQKIELTDYSCGRKYLNASYIKTETELLEFFKNE